MKLLRNVLVIVALTTGTRIDAAFVVEADNVAPAGKAFDHFVSTPPGTGFQLSVTPSTALGLAGNQSAFGNPANSTGPDRYELFYTPGIDADNTSFAPDTVLGNSQAFDFDSAGSDPPFYAIGPRGASGLTGGTSGLYNVYFTVPPTTNVNPAGSTITINNSAAPVVLNPVVMNNGGTGQDEIAGGTFTGGANNRWLLLGTVPLTAGNTYSVVIEANANPPDLVSQRTHGVMWELASGPITYQGVLANGITQNGSVSSNGTPTDPATAQFWSFSGNQGDTVVIEALRGEFDFDPAMWVFEGVFTNTAEFAGGSDVGFDGLDPGFLAIADDEIPNPGPFGDPQAAVTLTLPGTGQYTVAVVNFASDPNDGGDGRFDYSITMHVVPEPAPFVLMTIAAATSFCMRRSRFANR